MNKNELRAVMITHGDTYETLADALGIYASTLSNKINTKNGIGFNQPEIIAIKNRYNLTADQIDHIFFES
jgi:DNA-binding XRE family transcriptional regulator